MFFACTSFSSGIKSSGGIRKNLGIRTFFNMLGPLVNPASPKFQMIGVYNLEMARVIYLSAAKKRILLSQSFTAWTGMMNFRLPAMHE